MSRLTLPPAPPSALTLAIESPPVMLPMFTLPFERITVSPAAPELAVAPRPPAPPAPPVRLTRTRLVAAPVFPDVAIAEELAPLLASDTAVPDALASPVGPELPVSPDCAGACDELAAGA